MRRHIHAGILAATAVACSSGLAAQERAVGTNSSTVVVVGCVQRTEHSGTLGTTIPERAATPENAGVLANLGEPAPGFLLAAAVDAPAGSKPAAKNELPKRYVLVGNDTDFARHEGHRVRVSGTLAPSTKPADKPVGTSGSTQIKSETQRLKVTSVEMIAGACSQR
jgi:hypothetical protein